MNTEFKKLYQILDESVSECDSRHISLSGGLDSSIISFFLQPKKIKAISQKTQNLDFKMPEDNIYHNFPEWLEWLGESGLDISQFTSEDLSSISSHSISFPQFCRRLERRLDDPEGFKKQLEN